MKSKNIDANNATKIVRMDRVTTVDVRSMSVVIPTSGATRSSQLRRRTAADDHWMIEHVDVRGAQLTHHLGRPQVREESRCRAGMRRV
jgi:hypothetical protein